MTKQVAFEAPQELYASLKEDAARSERCLAAHMRFIVREHLRTHADRTKTPAQPAQAA
jgi:hypothetical protein